MGNTESISGSDAGSRSPGVSTASKAAGQNSGVEEDPCDPILDAYVKCAEGHQGIQPRKYEGEWCEEDKGLYIECRKNWAKERRARLAHAVEVVAKPWEKNKE